MEVHKKTELDKLEDYLIDKRITYERFDEDEERDEIGRILKCDRHQICVPEDGEGCRWDAICQRGSYGHERGLLEIYGELIVEEDGDSVKGYLTADDVIKRIEAKK